MDQIIEWKFRLSPLGEINEPGRAIVKTNNKKRLLDISIMIHNPKLSWGGVQKCLKLSRGAEIKIFVSGDKNIWHTRHFGGHVTTDTGKNICNSGRYLWNCAEKCGRTSSSRQQMKTVIYSSFFNVYLALSVAANMVDQNSLEFFCGKFAGLRGAWLPLLLAARLTNGFIVATVRAGDTGWSGGRQPPPYVLSSHQVIPRFKLQSSESFRDTGDVIMTLLGGRKCQNNVSPRFGNEYGWMVAVTGWYLQHNSSKISQRVWRARL